MYSGRGGQSVDQLPMAGHSARDHEARPALRERLAHRFELFNRTQLFGWVADAGLPAVACGDFHDLEHLAGWKTLLPSMHDEAAVVDYLRSRRPVYLIRLEADTDQLAA